jgi:hypothetical protein
MPDSASANIFFKKLKKVPFLFFKNIKGDWTSYVKDCERLYKKHPEYTSDVNAKPWDKKGKSMTDDFKVYRDAGYTKHNSKIWKTTGKKEKLTLEWEEKIAEQLPLENYIVTPTLQTPGQTLPYHVDQFLYLKRNTNSEYILRFLIFMSEWKSGHYLLVNDEILHKWRAGDCYVWHPDSPHIASNNGLENKWTCNVTGVYKAKI